MQRTSLFRTFTVLGLVAAAAACSDAPMQPSHDDADPVLARANALMGSHGRIHRSVADSRVVPLGGGTQVGPEVAASLTTIPFYCEPGNTNPNCPQIVVGAAVWDNGTSGGLRVARLYAHLDALENIASSELSVSYAVVGGCTGTPGTFDSETLTGGSNAGGDYALVASRQEYFSGTAKWRVNAYGQAEGTYGNFTEDSASDTECLI